MIVVILCSRQFCDRHTSHLHKQRDNHPLLERDGGNVPNGKQGLVHQLFLLLLFALGQTKYKICNAFLVNDESMDLV